MKADALISQTTDDLLISASVLPHTDCYKTAIVVSVVWFPKPDLREHTWLLIYFPSVLGHAPEDWVVALKA